MIYILNYINHTRNDIEKQCTDLPKTGALFCALLLNDKDCTQEKYGL